MFSFLSSKQSLKKDDIIFGLARISWMRNDTLYVVVSLSLGALLGFKMVFSCAMKISKWLQQCE
jgi:hypothetical protein